MAFGPSELTQIADKLMTSYAFHGDLQHLKGGDLLSKQRIFGILNDIRAILFPNLLGDTSLTRAPVSKTVRPHYLHTRKPD
ncbi:MAG: hypothetical protein ABR962_03410 [Candidatus Bathyarchaeia archaeon]|jgi:hypothetical protein